MGDNRVAVKPDVFASFSDIDKRTPQEKKAEMDPEDIALSSLSNHGGWTVLNGYIEHLKSEMDALVSSAVANGSSFEDVGRLTIVANLAKEKLYAVQKRVQDARDTNSGTGEE